MQFFLFINLCYLMLLFLLVKQMLNTILLLRDSDQCKGRGTPIEFYLCGQF